jgi:uncharacterized protein (TIGR00725 family)
MTLENLVIGFYGSGTDKHPGTALASQVGMQLAQEGAIVLCGGGKGLMEAVALAALGNGGRVLCVMPGKSGPKYVGPWPAKNLVSVSTEMSDGRNFLNAAVPHAAIAMDGGAGTLSEIALALKRKRLVVCLQSWNFLASFQPEDPSLLAFASSAPAAIATLSKGINAAYIAAQVARAATKPLQVPDQSANLAALRRQITAWKGTPTF